MNEVKQKFGRTSYANPKLGYLLDDWRTGFCLRLWQRFFALQRPEHLWTLPSLLFNEYGIEFARK